MGLHPDVAPSEISPKPQQDLAIVRQEWSNLISSPVNKAFDKLAEVLTASPDLRQRVEKPITTVYSASGPLLLEHLQAELERVKERTQKAKSSGANEDIALVALQTLAKASFAYFDKSTFPGEEKGIKYPFIVRQLPYNIILDPNGERLEWDELFVVVGRRSGFDDYIEISHRKVTRNADRTGFEYTWSAAEERTPEEWRVKGEAERVIREILKVHRIRSSNDSENIDFFIPPLLQE
jgi:hypothetical protein